jgi:hypothetical protein
VFIYSINEHKKDNLNRPDSESYLQSTLYPGLSKSTLKRENGRCSV